MHSSETKVYIILLVAAIALVIILLAFFTSLLRHHRNNGILYQQKIKAELFAREEERARISKDLHDDLGANLSAVKLYLSNISSVNPYESTQLDKAIKYVQESLETIHQITNDLYPTTIDRNGLLASIQDFINKINAANVLKISLTVSLENIDQQIDPKFRIHIFRTIKEIIQNTNKHSGSKELTIDVKNDKKLLVITTIDNGIGFNYNTVLEENEGNGLRNIINRIELIGGEIFIETDKGKGVKYTIQIPQTNESES